MTIEKSWMKQIYKKNYERGNVHENILTEAMSMKKNMTEVSLVS